MRVENYSQIAAGGDVSFSLCGREVCERDFYHNAGQVYKDSFLIHLILGGRGWYRLGEKVYELRAGQFFVIFRTDIVQYWPDPDDPWTFCWFAFRGERAGDYLAACGLTRECPTGALEQPGLLEGAISRLIALTEPGAQAENEVLIKGCVYEALGYVYREYKRRQPQSREDFKNSYIRKAFSYIENNYQRPITARDIARYVSLNQDYFTRLFKSAAGTSPSRYLKQFRVQQACRLLKCTDLPASHIASLTGYPNAYYFFRLFREETRLTPGEYRRRARKEK